LAIEAIFFDIGDTLVSDSPTLEERIWAASARCGIDYDRDRLPAAIRRVEDYALEAYVDGDTTDDPAVMVRTASRLLQELGTGQARAGDLVQAFAEIPFERVLHADALPMIDTLKGRGFKIGVVSDWDPLLPELLSGWDLMPRLDGLAVSAIVGCMKPDSRLFRHALKDAGVDAACALHVGDFYELDVAGARAAGMSALLFDWRDRVPNADCPRVTSFSGVVEYLLALPSPV
jgi:2-haloacid dehalogenase/putative hydrolase of the HAD superfamily